MLGSSGGNNPTPIPAPAFNEYTLTVGEAPPEATGGAGYIIGGYNLTAPPPYSLGAITPNTFESTDFGWQHCYCYFDGDSFYAFALSPANFDLGDPDNMNEMPMPDLGNGTLFYTDNDGNDQTIDLGPCGTDGATTGYGWTVEGEAAQAFCEWVKANVGNDITFTLESSAPPDNGDNDNGGDNDTDENGIPLQPFFEGTMTPEKIGTSYGVQGLSGESSFGELTQSENIPNPIYGVDTLKIRDYYGSLIPYATLTDQGLAEFDGRNIKLTFNDNNDYAGKIILMGGIDTANLNKYEGASIEDSDDLQRFYDCLIANQGSPTLTIQLF